MMWFNSFGIILLLTSVQAKRGFGPGKQDYGYVDVRRGAHMFWWLFHTTADVYDSSERPLILWLQGGPGGSSCGFGNFELIGPLDVHLNPRNTTWVKDFNVLFVDNPVGTGFSYVDNLSLVATDNKRIAEDLVSLLKSFYDLFPKFKTTPFYVYGQSYGGKMAVEFVKTLHEEVKLGKIQSNVMGVAMGNSWISPIDSSLSYSGFLYGMSLVDERGRETIDKQAQVIKKYFDQGQYAEATDGWRHIERIILGQTDGINYYNVLDKIERGSNPNHRYYKDGILDVTSGKGKTRNDDLNNLMNGPVKRALNIPNNVKWGGQYSAVFFYLRTDFMKPVTEVVESLLNQTNIKIHVYNGNVDLICNTPGQMAWINRLKWPNAAEFHNATRKTIWVENTMEGYEKSAGKFSVFSINVAGHDVPIDNPAGMRYVLESMTGV